MPSIFLFAAYDFAFFKAVFLCAVALGLIIFIHELGHFLVAKACGVRCDKFYIGFDFFGLKLLKFKWGETEYGIGVFPLGGYVKMLGQEDNPGETRERINKAKAAREALAKNAEAKVDQAVLMTDEEIAEAEKLINDPRSYQAKSVPQRMAIIVAGVTMNVVLAFIAAAAAFMLGTSKLPCQLGSVHPGQGAWEAGLQSNDTLVQIEQNELKYFDDISKNVTLGNHLEEGINIQFERPSMPLIQTTKAFPKKTALAPMLGATAPLVPVLDETPVTPASPTFMAENDLKKGDVLVGIDEAEISINLDVQKALYASVGKNV
ncbi:MAG: site-2 protease family protein, partial [Thermoguttaceae bacterium]|nr:site-2 protease family protein [Thermoguttaceae bacterium]